MSHSLHRTASAAAPSGRSAASTDRTLSRRITVGRVFLRAERVVRNRYRAIHPIWSGFWLGILPTRAIDGIDKALYDTMAQYRSPEHNLQGLFSWEAEAVRTNFAGCSRLMILGAGGGREVIALRRLGFEADGWEPNPTLVAVAQKLLRAEACGGSVHVGPRSRVPEVATSYHGIIFGWTMYMLVPGRSLRIEFLRQARSRLVTGAPLLLSFQRRPEECLRSARVMRVARPVRRLVLRDPPELGDDMSPVYRHRFTQDDVERELEAGGFRLVRYEHSDGDAHGHGWAVGEAS